MQTHIDNIQLLTAANNNCGGGSGGGVCLTWWLFLWALCRSSHESAFQLLQKGFCACQNITSFWELYYCCSLKCSRKEWTFTSERESLVYPFFRDGQTTHSMFPFIQLTCLFFFSRLLLCEIKYTTSQIRLTLLLFFLDLNCPVFFCQRVCVNMESKKEWKCRRKTEIHWSHHITTQWKRSHWLSSSFLLSSGILENGNRQLETF